MNFLILVKIPPCSQFWSIVFNQQKLNTVTIDENKCAYDVLKCNSVTCVSKESLINNNVTSLVTVSNGKLYVAIYDEPLTILFSNLVPIKYSIFFADILIHIDI